MAKKKVTHQPKQPQEQTQPNKDHNDPVTTTTAAAMDESYEKLQSLKSLNSLLLKETHERRLQVDTLVQSNKALESELTRSSMEKNVMNVEFTRLSEEVVGLELEKGLVSVFLETQMSEMAIGRAEVELKTEGLRREKEKVRKEKEVEIGVLKQKVSQLMGDFEKEREISSCVTRERDGLKEKLGAQIQAANKLRGKVTKMEERESKLIDEAKQNKLVLEGMVKENMERDSKMKLLVQERDLAEKRMVEAGKVNEELKAEFGRILNEKNEIEEQRIGQMVKAQNLEEDVSELNRTVLLLRGEEARLSKKVVELEKSNAEVIEKQALVLKEYNALQEQKEESERKIEKLLEEKTETLRSLEVHEKEFERLRQKIESIIQEKSVIEDVNTRQNSDILELQNELVKLQNSVLALQRTCKDQEEKNKHLECDVSQHRDVIARAKVEKSDVEKLLEEEKKNGVGLLSKVSELETKLGESLKEINRMRSGCDVLIKESKDLGNQCEMLTRENVNLKNSLSENQEELSDFQARLDSQGANSEWVLTMLKNMSEMVSKSRDERNGKDDLLTNEQKIEEVQPYLVELEAIKNAFRIKESNVDELKRQLEFLQNSVAEANKKKNLWTLMSSATTLFVAASIAYVARGN